MSRGTVARPDCTDESLARQLPPTRVKKRNAPYTIALPAVFGVGRAGRAAIAVRRFPVAPAADAAAAAAAAAATALAPVHPADGVQPVQLFGGRFKHCAAATAGRRVTGQTDHRVGLKLDVRDTGGLLVLGRKRGSLPPHPLPLPLATAAAVVHGTASVRQHAQAVRLVHVRRLGLSPG